MQRPAPAAAVAALPDPAAADAYDLTPHCGNWFRICRESLVRDGAGGRDPALARIWSLLDPAAQDACRAVVAAPDAVADHVPPLLDGCNRLLRRRDLWDAAAFARVHLPLAARDQLAAHAGPPTGGRELQRFNRILLQSAIECLHSYRCDLALRATGLARIAWLDDDPRGMDAATRHLVVAERCAILPAELHLHDGALCAGLAECWDRCQHLLDPAARAVWLRWIERMLRFYLDTARQRSWTVTAIPNANPVGNGGAGRLALAVLGDLPELAQAALRHARTAIWNWLDYCHGADGGNTEGVQYWQYAMENFLPFALALERVTGSHDGMLEQPAVTRCMAMLRLALCADGATHGVNDTIPLALGGGIAWFAAGRFDDDFARWYGDHALRWYRQRREAGRPVPYRPLLWDALVWREPLAAPQQAPPLPRVVVLDDIAQATLRSQPRWDCEWVAGLKGARPPYTHHCQDDAGSCFVHRRGERLVIDPGYYKPAADDHSLSLIAGRGPTIAGAHVGGIVDRGEAPGRCWVTVDTTRAWPEAITRVRRTLVVVADLGVVVVDDIAAQRPVAVQTRFQCGGPTTVQAGGGVQVQGRATALALRPLSHPQAACELAPERRLDDVHWGYTFADCRWFPVTIAWRASGDRPLVVLLGDPAVAATAIDRGEQGIRLVIAGREPLDLRRQPDGWSPVPVPVRAG